MRARRTDYLRETTGPGIGYATSGDESGVFISAEGEDWLRMVSTKKLLIEPLIAEGNEKAIGDVLVLPKPSIAIEEVDQGIESGAEVVLPTELLPAYPNPFNPATKIAYELERMATVNIVIYDVRGRMVKEFRVEN
jgi:hypothetical protein